MAVNFKMDNKLALNRALKKGVQDGQFLQVKGSYINKTTKKAKASIKTPNKSTKKAKVSIKKAKVSTNKAKPSLNQRKMTEQEMWKWIEQAQWSKDHNLKRVQQFLKNNLDFQQLQQLGQFVHDKVNVLYETFEAYDDLPIGDDSYSDLLAEVVSRGKQFYENINIKKLKNMIENNDYAENFEYVFQDFQ